MKTRFLLVATLVLVSAAATDSPAPTPAPPVSEFVDPDSPGVAEVRALGERAINRLAFTMVNEVAVTVAKHGTEKAVDMCHLKALPLTGEIISGMPRITAVKRTSLRLRNPANAPDAADQLALERVQKDMEAGTLPKVLVQRIDLPAGKHEWRIYRPIGVAQQCITCHGARDSFSPDLQARLAKAYPADKATGYSVGQWRGLIRVTVADPPPVPAAAGKAPTRKF